MGRRKGDTYRKEKLKENKRVMCPNWTLGEDTLMMVQQISSELGVCQSRLVDIALRKILINSTQNIKNPAKLFTEN